MVKSKKKDQVFASKIVFKKHLDKDLHEAVFNELHHLRRLDGCPNILKLHHVYESPNNIYLILDYKNDGDLKEYRFY